MAAAAGRWGWGVAGGFRRAATASATSGSACWLKQQPAAVRPRILASVSSACRRLVSGNAGGGGPGSEVTEARAGGGLERPRRASAASPLEAMNLLGPMGAHRSTIESYNSEGFVINGTLVKGAVVILPETVMFWNVGEMKDMTWESLSIVNVMAKKPEVCILGTGRRLQRLPPEVHLEFKKLGIHLDVMDSVNAGATFNVLNQVCELITTFAALSPPFSLDPSDFHRSLSHCLYRRGGRFLHSSFRSNQSWRQRKKRMIQMTCWVIFASPPPRTSAPAPFSTRNHPPTKRLSRPPTCGFSAIKTTRCPRMQRGRKLALFLACTSLCEIPKGDLSVRKFDRGWRATRQRKGRDPST